MITYFLKHAPVARKIQMAFGCLVVAVLGCMAFLTWQTNALKSEVSGYREAARTSVSLSNVGRDFQGMRVEALKFEIDGNPTALANLEKLKTAATTQVEKLIEMKSDPAQIQALKELIDLANKYQTHAVSARTDPAARDQRNQVGPQIAALLDKQIGEARAKQDVLGPAMQRSLNTASMTTVGVALGALAFGILFSIVLSSVIAGPFARTTTQMEDVAKGDLSVVVDTDNRRDDVGRLQRALQVFIQNAHEVRRLDAEQAEMKRSAEAANRVAMNSLADQFEASVMQIVDTVASAATELQASAGVLSRTAHETAQHSASVARTSEASSGDVQTVASASEEMSASIAEIAQQTGQSSNIARLAADKASATTITVKELSEAVQRIGAVVNLISDIASQTNLLALNATIEAARAGEAGRGFAVVASEVKSLAEQTARATEEISSQINAVQSATGDAVNAIEGIASTISEINEASTAVAGAVEEQMAAVHEISRATSDVARGTAEITTAIAMVEAGASETGAAASQSLGASEELGRQAILLREEAAKFIERIRAA